MGVFIVRVLIPPQAERQRIKWRDNASVDCRLERGILYLFALSVSLCTFAVKRAEADSFRRKDGCDN